MTSDWDVGSGPGISWGHVDCWTNWHAIATLTHVYVAIQGKINQNHERPSRCSYSSTLCSNLKGKNKI